MKKKSQFFAIIVCLLAMSFVLSAESSQREPQERQARQILDATGLKGGLVVHIGCSDGKLTAALCANDSYIVHGLDTNVDNVETAREHIRSLGLYGKVSAQLFSGGRLPYADNLINLIVSEDLGKVPIDEVMRVLAPRGMAYIGKEGNRTKTIKPWPKEIDEWTHWLHDATGNAVAQDMLVGPPRHLQWVANPLWSRHHDTVPSVSAMVSSHGRLFYISDEAPAGIDGTVPDRWFLVARDGFNGVLLWKRAMPEWGWRQWSATWHGRFNQPSHLPGRLVAVGDTIYVTLGFNAPLTALDAATGKLIRTYEGTDNTDEILYHEGLLVLALNNETRKPAKDKRTPINKSICVIEAETGKMLWKKGEYQGLHPKADSGEPFGCLGMVIGGGRIFLMDGDSIVSLDLKTGDKLWRVPRPKVPEFVALFGMRMNDLCVLVCHNDIVLYAQPEMQIRDPWHSIPGTLYAFSAKSGNLIWKHRYGGWSHFYQPDIFVIDNLVWIHEHVDAQEGQGKTLKKHQLIPKQDTLDYAVLGLDPATGKVKRRFSTRETFNVGHHHRCYRNKATARFLLTSRRGVEFLDTKSGENQLHHWARGGCLFGIVPCNGLLYLTPHPCDCYIATKLNGFFALASEHTDRQYLHVVSNDDILERGPAYGAIENRKSTIENPNDWPTYRHDPQRTGSTKSAVPTNLQRLWQAEIGGKLTPPVVADGKLFVASVDSHTIHAINADNGKTLWTYTAAGRVDSPPTIYRGLMLFGSADGWVYCLTASDGKLAWRYLAAPRQRLVGAFGQLESAWPVNGSVLVKDGLAYVAAGRSSYLDQGVFLYLLDPETGKVAGKKVVYSPDPETDRMPPGDHRTIPGVLADILVSDGASVYMRQMKVFDGEGEDAPHIFSTAGFLDDSWFNRTQWSVAGTAHGQMLVFDNESAYGVQAYPNISRKNVFHPGEKGYLLFASELKTSSGRRPIDGRSTSGKQRQMRAKWSLHVPVRVMALVLADKTLFAAGTPDVVAPSDPLRAFEGRMGTVLCAFSASDGRKLAEYKLNSPPIFDGMIASNRRLYISTRDGRLICMGK